jgi:hypothetical protein
MSFQLPFLLFPGVNMGKQPEDNHHQAHPPTKPHTKNQNTNSKQTNIKNMQKRVK